MNIVLMTKNKPICNLAYQWCKDNKNINIVSLVAPSDFNSRAIDQSELLSKIDKLNIDLVVSFLYWRKIKEPLLSCPKIGCINFHPAPLPEYKGVAPYSRAIMDGVNEWGVTAHFIDEDIDTGDIIKVNKFSINHKEETSYSLVGKTMVYLFDIFKDVLTDIISGKKLSRVKQYGGTYFSMDDLDILREIRITDTKEEIDRKTRAFWCPPHDGAYVNINGNQILAVPRCALKNFGG